VILAGGGALLPGAVELAQQVFDAPVRMGKPIDLGGWSEQVDSPQFATVVGLLRFALRQKSAQATAEASSTVGGIGTEPQRRIWSIPAQGSSGWAVPSPQLSAAELAQQNVYSDKLAPHEPESTRENGAPGTLAERGESNLPTDERDDDAELHETPFDSDNRRFDAYEDEEPLWRRLLTKLRQLIGFESA
jgi:cell division ATPase FtsA